MRAKTLASILIAAVFAIAPVAAQARPTFREARTAVHWGLDRYSDSTDGKLILGGCTPRGRKSVVCRARIDGPVPARYRCIITGWFNGDANDPDSYLQMRIRPR
jgi:hypothetical protein